MDDKARLNSIYQCLQTLIQESVKELELRKERRDTAKDVVEGWTTRDYWHAQVQDEQHWLNAMMNLLQMCLTSFPADDSAPIIPNLSYSRLIETMMRTMSESYADDANTLHYVRQQHGDVRSVIQNVTSYNHILRIVGALLTTLVERQELRKATQYSHERFLSDLKRDVLALIKE